METLDTIIRIIMISSIGGMIVYFTTQGFEAINRATTHEPEPEDYNFDELDNTTNEVIDFDEACYDYLMQLDKEDKEGYIND